MRQRISVCVIVVTLVAVCSAAQRGAEVPAGQQFTGTWSGTWDGAGAGGGFELTLEKGSDGTLGGRVSVTGQPTYKATLKSLSFDGAKLKGAYDFTPDASGEVLLTATFEGNTSRGTWSLRSKADAAEVATGTFTLTRK